MQWTTLWAAKSYPVDNAIGAGCSSQNMIKSLYGFTPTYIVVILILPSCQIPQTSTTLLLQILDLLSCRLWIQLP